MEEDTLRRKSASTVKEEILWINMGELINLQNFAEKCTSKVFTFLSPSWWFWGRGGEQTTILAELLICTKLHPPFSLSFS